MESTVGKILKELRIGSGFTQEELGSKIGVKKAAIGKYESGAVENLKRQTAIRLAEIFEVSPAYIMGFCKNEKVSRVVEILNKAEEEETEKILIQIERNM